MSLPVGLLLFSTELITSSGSMICSCTETGSNSLSSHDHTARSGSNGVSSSHTTTGGNGCLSSHTASSGSSDVFSSLTTTSGGNCLSSRSTSNGSSSLPSRSIYNGSGLSYSDAESILHDIPTTDTENEVPFARRDFFDQDSTHASLFLSLVSMYEEGNSALEFLLM